MESYHQVILFVFVSVLTIFSITLMSLIIWYIKSKPPGKTLPFDCVFIDGSFIQTITFFNTSIGVLIKIIFDRIEYIYAISFSFVQYSLVRCVISSEIVTCILRVLYLNNPSLIIGASDSKVRKIAWTARLAITGILVCLITVHLFLLD